VFELTGAQQKIDAFVDLMKPLGLVEVSRTGVVAISRGAEAMCASAPLVPASRSLPAGGTRKRPLLPFGPLATGRPVSLIRVQGRFTQVRTVTPGPRIFS
jgi:hypothetical protein